MTKGEGGGGGGVGWGKSDLTFSPSSHTTNPAPLAGEKGRGRGKRKRKGGRGGKGADASMRKDERVPPFCVGGGGKKKKKGEGTAIIAISFRHVFPSLFIVFLNLCAVSESIRDERRGGKGKKEREKRDSRRILGCTKRRSSFPQEREKKKGREEENIESERRGHLSSFAYISKEFASN